MKRALNQKKEALTVSDANRWDEFVNTLKVAIIDGDFDSAPKITEDALKAGAKPEVLMGKAISEGINELEEKLFGGYKAWGHPILFFAVEAARRSLELLEPHFKPRGEQILGTVVLGTPTGDVHDMGGKMVALTLMAAGFKVIYLGRDVPSSLFIHKVRESGAKILAISSYQTTGFDRIREILDLLSAAGIRDKVKVMVGGSSITEKFADKFALGYGRYASEAVKLAKKYVGGR